MKLHRMVTKEEISFFVKVYKEAFPKNERRTFSFLFRKRFSGVFDLLIAKEKDKNVGILVTTKFKNSIFIDYFAIDKDHRSNGYGSKILESLKEYYESKNIILEIEKLDKESSDYQVRKKRYEFYKKNKFYRTNIYSKFNNFELEVLSTKQNINQIEYTQIIDYIHN